MNFPGEEGIITSCQSSQKAIELKLSIIKILNALNKILGRLSADYYHAKSKDKLIADFLKSLPAGESILDVGAGQMPYRPLCSHLDYISQDFCRYHGSDDGTGIQTTSFNTRAIDIVSDITCIPLPDVSLDNVLCTEVLEHVEDLVAAIQEIRRVLKPGGKVLITVPGTSLLHFSPYHFYTGFKTNFFKSVL
jgi:SAM-dependent methyltransferase